MTDPLSDRMDRLETVSERASDAARERDELARSVGDDLSEYVETAIDSAGANVVATTERPSQGRFRFEARLDRARLIAALVEELPDGFALTGVAPDGSLGIEWTGGDRPPGKRDRDAILKAIVAEETVVDADGLIIEVPTRERVLDRAEELGVGRDVAAERLERLVTLDMIDVDDGYVYPDENFSRI
jgi:hypothetical protein